MPRLKILMPYLQNEMFNHNDSDDYVEYLILNGYVEVAGIDPETQEFLYSFTDEARNTVPGLQQQLNEEFYELIVYLWEHGFISMDIESESPRVALTPKALNQYEVSKLPQAYRHALMTIIEALRIQ
jgi:hypothetical protein